MTTITHRTAAELIVDLKRASSTDECFAALTRAGITITDPEPPEAMVKLAREMVAGLPDRGLVQWTERDLERAALAALQHVEKAVREEGRHWENGRSAKAALLSILTAIGAKL